MSQSKPEFEKVNEFNSIAEKLLKKYPDVLDGLDLSTITCVAVTNKEQKEGKPVYELLPVKYPVRLDVPFDIYIIVNGQSWETFDESHKAITIFAALCSIDKEQPGKVVPFDLKDHSVIVRTIGTDYMTRDNIPNILQEDISWKKD